ncbi:MAG: aminoglycoside 6-adenylyltransferase [Lachnospiraceae bacterium]|nr:aminoglycoside 6-adenylyltransferase [Lachnospiraceae bacterium]
MRTGSNIISKVLEAADEDENVRAVIRTNFLPVRKYLYDYQFYFVVNDTDKYDDSFFESCFGERILLFRGDKNYPEMFPDTKAYLMVFGDGITLVINIITKTSFLNRYNGVNEYENVWIGDTFKKILDKDESLPEIERLEEKQTVFAKAPTEEEFMGANSEFWWVMKTFAEYTARKELPAAMFYLNMSVRPLLNNMIRQYIYLKSGKPADMGILDSNMEKLLDEELFLIYKKTYPDADYEHIRMAFDAAAELWNKTGRAVAKYSGFTYPEKTEKRMLDFINEFIKEQSR